MPFTARGAQSATSRRPAGRRYDRADAKAALPELEGIRHDAIAAPVRGPRDRGAAMACIECGEALFEPGAACDRRALGRGGRADLRFARTAGEIGIRRFRIDALDPPVDAHLAFEHRPKEHERRVRVRRQLLPFALRSLV